MPRNVRPYLVPGPSTAVLGEWELLVSGTWEPLPPELPDWDATVSLSLRRTATLDLDRLRAETRLADDATLRWTVSWISSTSKMRGAAPTFPVTTSGTTLIEAHLAGDRIGGTLTLHTTLALAQTSGDSRSGAPRLAGSVLIADSAKLILGDTASGFPVATIDFAATRLDPHASWHLETTTDLFAPFLGGFLLLINTRDTELVRATKAERPDRRQEALIDELDNGVTALLVELAAHHRVELSDTDGWPPGSVGETLSRMLARAEAEAPIHAPTGPDDLAAIRTRAAGVARAIGLGRRFQ